jgi:uncharacterized UBP type Zn finger protein
MLQLEPEVDKGGAVVPIETCPHLAACIQSEAHIETLIQNQLPGLSLTEFETTPCCTCLDTEERNIKENWLCITCGETFCSRYQKGHCLQHFRENNLHSVMLSFSDLCVWCHSCESYIKHSSLLKLKVYAEAYKFKTLPKLHLIDVNPAPAPELMPITESNDDDECGF